MTKHEMLAAKKRKAQQIASRCRIASAASATWVKVALAGEFKKR